MFKSNHNGLPHKDILYRQKSVTLNLLPKVYYILSFSCILLYYTLHASTGCYLSNIAPSLSVFVSTRIILLRDIFTVARNSKGSKKTNKFSYRKIVGNKFWSITFYEVVFQHVYTCLLLYAFSARWESWLIFEFPIESISYSVTIISCHNIIIICNIY